MNKWVARTLLVLFIYMIFFLTNIATGVPVIESLGIALGAMLIMIGLIVGFWTFIMLIEYASED